MARELSLANKCQILFGAATVLIVAAALLGPWLRLDRIVNEAQQEIVAELARYAASPYENHANLSIFTTPPQKPALESETGAPQTVIRVAAALRSDFDELQQGDSFAARAIRRFQQDPDRPAFGESFRIGGEFVRRQARQYRNDEGELTRVIFVEHRSRRAASLLFVDRLYLLAAGVFAGTLALFVFWFITTRLILSPVKELRHTCTRVAEGDLTVRSRINTGDEFEQFADSFNSMLASISLTQDRLREINASLDLKVAQLTEANVDLNEAALLKNDFIASVSHELRTPLNSIIGFAELLLEIAAAQPEAETEHEKAMLEKRGRYLDNIVRAGRNLLEMINDLLEMAKIEAGKVDLHVERAGAAALCEGLVALIRPQAERREIELLFEAPSRAEDPLLIETDPRKLEQIVFNFLSNAVKFTPEQGRIVLRVERIMTAGEPAVRISVIDTGPGIAPEDQERIFDSFSRVELGHARQHKGTGLGLTIAKRLADMIQGEIRVESALGQGAMFSLILPINLDPNAAVDMTLRLAGRSTAARQNPPRPTDQPLEIADHLAGAD
ncbi:MAG: HAMP domain-containing histidine kinase [Phycisphaeraceae bacterium]|nr:HAMP domain-containing histidine kinase [Phycisphaeraceae bacterium]MCB9848106.1 HAMP domain-containing histidine kinase [Phycisphaeraceae bacterium]